MERMFRNVKSDEIECRVATCKLPDGDRKGGCSLLLYKDARVDQNILDETVGPMNWMRKHTRDNANCIVSIWDEKKGQWIDKEDTGTESNTEAEKGLASDSFKRACFNWGIGRELYTAPFIWISSDACKIFEGRNGKPQCLDRFDVQSLDVDDGRITEIKILNENTKQLVFSWSLKKQEKKQEEKPVDKAVEKPVDKQVEKPAEVAPVDEAKLAMKKDIIDLAFRAKVGTEQILKMANVKDLADLSPMLYAKVKAGLLRKIEADRGNNS